MGKSANRKQIKSGDEVSKVTDTSPKDLPVAELMKSLNASGDGLTREDVEHRLEKYGYNEIEEKKVSPILKFLSYFWGPNTRPILVNKTFTCFAYSGYRHPDYRYSDSRLWISNDSAGSDIYRDSMGVRSSLVTYQ
jgi:magnesium-transporting ATPase (P-type)